MTPDVINSLFLFVFGTFILNHCRVCYKDKKVNGVSILSVFVFLLGGCYNLFFYYDYLNQPISKILSGFMVVADGLYLYLLMYYRYWRVSNE